MDEGVGGDERAGSREGGRKGLCECRIGWCEITGALFFIFLFFFFSI